MRIVPWIDRIAIDRDHPRGFVRLPGPECYDPPTPSSDGQICGIGGPKAERVRPRMKV